MNSPKKPTGMKLTPIRMRGKRKSNRSNTNAGSNDAFSSSLLDSRPEAAPEKARLATPGTSPRKRPRASSPKALQKGSCDGPAPARRARTKKPVPFDQRFPFEVIERIFFFSMNFNLPRASPRFGWMLSSRHTLRDLIFAAFEPQWELTLTKKRYQRPTKISSPRAVKAHARVNDSDLQAAVLNTPWMKMDLLVDAMQIWLKRHKDKRYLHAPVPSGYDSARDIASKFVLNLDDFDSLIKQHPSEHHLSPDLFATEQGNLTSGGNGQPPTFGFILEPHAIATMTKRGSAWPSVDDENEGQSEGEDDTPDEPPAASAQDENDIQSNGGNINGNRNDNDNDNGNGNDDDDSRPRASAHVCFAMDQYGFLENMYQENEVEPRPDETPSELAAADLRDPSCPLYGHFITIRTSVAAALPLGPSLWTMQIPEWLQLAGGPYPATKNQSQTREGRKALRNRLRETFDLLSWIVFAGGKLQKKDSWELTWQGFQSLLEIDVLPSEWDAYEDGEDVVKSCQHTSAGPGGGKTIRLQYSVDALVCGILGLFYSLGVFYYQMPQHIFESAMEMATQRGVSGGEAYRQSQTYLVLQRIAAIIPNGNNMSLLELFPEEFGMRF